MVPVTEILLHRPALMVVEHLADFPSAETSCTTLSLLLLQPLGLGEGAEGTGRGHGCPFFSLAVKAVTY